VRIGVHPTRGDLVEQRLPHVRRELIDERDFHLVAAAIFVAELRRKRQSARATADDEDSVR